MMKIVIANIKMVLSVYKVLSFNFYNNPIKWLSC